MKNIYVLFIFFLLLSNYSFSQKSELLIKTGFVRGDFNISDIGKEIYKANKINYTPRIDILGSVIFDNNFIFGIGCGYYKYSYAYDKKNMIAEEDYLFKALSGKIFFGYNFNFTSSFKLTYNSGVCLDLYFFNDITHKYKSGMLPTIFGMKYYTLEMVYSSYLDDYKFFNILLFQSLNLSYEFKNNFKLSLFAEYYSGLVNDFELSGYVNIKYFDDISDMSSFNLLTKGNHFYFGIGLGYIFGN